MNDKALSRKEQILQSLAQMLEDEPGGRITTAGLAREVGVSEAALYRHFPSKTRMFEGLIDYAEEQVFSRINQITSSDFDALTQTGQILTLLVGFTSQNPGISRLLNGDALTGENERLRQRIQQFYDRVESQLRQVLRDAELREGLRTQATPATTASLLIAVAEGRIGRFVRSGFRDNPINSWQEHWGLLQKLVFRS